MAVSLLRSGEVKKIVLVRPAVEAGERLGFLPGDIVAKVNPYLRPLFDSLNDMMEPEAVKRYMDNDIIEVVPLAYMRGRTLNNAVIILDEGQNTTVPQMKMFLTRMGEGSKIIVTGDVTQVDLPKQTRSGMTDAMHRLRDIDGIALVYLDENDIVRHPLYVRFPQKTAAPGSVGRPAAFLTPRRASAGATGSTVCSATVVPGPPDCFGRYPACLFRRHAAAFSLWRSLPARFAGPPVF